MIVPRSVSASSFAYRKQLVDQLIEEGACSSPPLREAFLAVPREAFLSGFYKKKGSGFSWEWVPTPNPEVPDQAIWQAWFEQIYQDAALTTQIDANGRPTSSSSQPSVMGMMLEALSVVPGKSHILEIGAGSGYNAALLAASVGVNHLVTTIEIDAHLAEQARQRLTQVMGSGIEVVVGDGLQFSAEARYDRIIVTGSAPTVPEGWIHALTPSGILVMDLRGDIAGGLLRVQKRKDGTASGFFLPQGNAIFMPLRPQNELVTRPSVETNGPTVESALVASQEFSPEVLRHPDAGLWLQCAFPHIRVRRQYPIGSSVPIIYLIDTKRQTTMVISSSESGTGITVQGTYPLWTQFYEAYQLWRAESQPKRERYRIHVDQGNRMRLSAE